MLKKLVKLITRSRRKKRIIVNILKRANKRNKVPVYSSYDGTRLEAGLDISDPKYNAYTGKRLFPEVSLFLYSTCSFSRFYMTSYYIKRNGEMI